MRVGQLKFPKIECIKSKRKCKLSVLKVVPSLDPMRDGLHVGP